MCVAVVFMLASGVVQAAASQVPHVAKPLGEKKTSPLGHPLMMKDPSAMLTELEEMVHSGETPAFDLIKTIKSIIQDDIEPDLQATRDVSAGETTEHLDTIQTCNDDSKVQADNIEKTKQASVNSARSDHAVCRDEQKTLYQHNLTNPESYCVKLGKFLHETTALSIAGMSRAAAVSYVKAASTNSNMCSLSEVSELDGSCRQKEDELVVKGTECLQKQKYFEAAFCDWKVELELNCQQLDSCHSTAVTDYWHHVNKTKILLEKWNVESAALQKILCYCNVWMSGTDEGDDRSPHNASQFDVCRYQTYTPSSVDHGTPSPKVACPLTAVNCHPGETCFDQEYSSFADFVATTVGCTRGNLFAFGAKGVEDGCAAGYLAIDEEATCEAAADYLGYSIRDGRVHAINAYPGCYFDGTSEMAYFNRHLDAQITLNPKIGQLCKLESTTAAPQTAGRGGRF